MEGLRKATRNFSQDSLSPGRDFVQEIMINKFISTEGMSMENLRLLRSPGVVIKDLWHGSKPCLLWRTPNPPNKFSIKRKKKGKVVPVLN
jgi:hypothetical protein